MRDPTNPSSEANAGLFVSQLDGAEGLLQSGDPHPVDNSGHLQHHLPNQRLVGPVDVAVFAPIHSHGLQHHTRADL